MKFVKKLEIVSKKNLTVNLYTTYRGKVNTNFCNNKIPKECSQCICLSAILIGSIYRKDEKYSQVFLEECKHVVKEKRMSKYITDKREIPLMILIEK